MYKILSKLILSASLIVMSAIATESIKDDFTTHIKKVKDENKTIDWMQDDGTLGDNISKTSDSIEVLTDIISDVLNNWEKAEDAQNKFIEDMKTKTDLTPANLNYIGIKNWAYKTLYSDNENIDNSLFTGFYNINNNIETSIEDVSKYISAFEVKNFITDELRKLKTKQILTDQEIETESSKNIAQLDTDVLKNYQEDIQSTINKSPSVTIPQETTDNSDKKQGTIKYAWGKYEGELKNGHPEGDGKFTIGNNKFKGTIEKDGLMKIEKNDSTKIESIKNSEDEYIYYSRLDGSIYYGEMKQGKKDGFGSLHNTDGNLYEGDFTDGKYVKGTIVYTNGTIAEGEFKNGERSGDWLETDTQGNFHRGKYIKGKKDGNWEIKDKDNEVVRTETWRDGSLIKQK